MIVLAGRDVARWTSRGGVRLELVRGPGQVRAFGCDGGSDVAPTASRSPSVIGEPMVDRVPISAPAASALARLLMATLPRRRSGADAS